MSTSEHFSNQELSCPCCGLNNVKPELLEKLERVRAFYGKPIIIGSASRCEDHNRRVGGVPGSAHLTGEAVDIRCHFGTDRFDLIRLFQSFGFNRIGISFDGDFIHIDISDTLPQSVIWGYK